MTVPTAPLFPDNFDSDNNLYVVHDSLRLSLLDDYNPGDTSIVATGDPVVIVRIPPTGQVTLTEQCSDLDKRAITFYYGSF